eukprot:CAMPEP_0176447860 /NCGR_PEP_ID=MMETSP0127-20121128/25338_1 /TAXON_ID=938130 /ORGANISM="Platyophrya macrostoma, Strain WH" /LENGTH=642 /DNA_ID=CAMNT_0017834497 /DNA_START=100 /DNA_END=2031 /DNA_ORIENTATION=+
MAVRDLHKEPPYPGFSLDEVLRKRALRGATLSRGDNAWRAASAKTQDEGIARIVQGALNKLAPEKYSDVVNQLLIPAVVASERSMEVAIDLIFKKALLEPGYSEMYARLCYDMATYELRLQAQSPSATTPLSDGSTPKKSSKFRENIIRCAHREFQLTDPHQFDDLEGEELEEAKTSLIKRKKANITFVGQLFLRKVLSQTIMHQIIQNILKTGDAKAELPEEIDIEVLNALLETVGKTLDQNEHRERIDLHFDRLKQLKDHPKYSMRIRFKIMNLLDLRSNMWEPRVMRADNQAPTTLQEQQSKQSVAPTPSSSSATLKLGPRSPTASCTPNGRRGGMQRFPSTSQFPDSPQPTGAANSSNAAASDKAGGWRNVSAPQRESPVAYTPADFISRANNNASKDIPFDTRVKNFITEWVNEGTNEPVATWRNRFKQGEFETDDELCQAVIAEAVREACIVTKKEAQREACSFIRVALNLDPDDEHIALGLGSALVRAVEEGIKEDVPKFYERFVQVLHLVTEKDTILELYCDAAKLLYVTEEQIRAIEGLDAVEEMLEVWRLLPRPENAAEKLPDLVVSIVVNLRESGQDELAAALIESLVQSELIEKSIVEGWFSTPSAAQSQKVVTILKERLDAIPSSSNPQ